MSVISPQAERCAGRMMNHRRLLSFGALLGAVLAPSSLLAEPLRLHLRSGLGVPLGGHQADEFGVGVGGALGLEFPLTPRVGLMGELGTLWLSEGDPPSNPQFQDTGAGALLSGMVGLHVRPWNTTDLAAFDQAAGIWSSASAGLGLTGGLQRFVVELAVGYDVFVDRGGTLGLGPMLAWSHVFQPDSELRPSDANVLMLGIHATFDGVVREYLDTDGDGIVDVKDACPTVAEDSDDYQDGDGCPEDDNDGDGILDHVDHCPMQPEDGDGFEDEDGCPDLDNDRDGVPDAQDKCPLESEDHDQFQDEDGCPDPDNDQDGIKDAEDACPNEPEVFNNYADHDGCPDADQVRVVGDKIVLDDKVHFATNSAIIRSVSYGLLSRVAALIQEHPDYIHIEVHGHADRRGDDAFNRDLSERRAQSVMNFLIDEGGLDASRLSFKGFGSDQPLMDKDTEWAWFMNRRVEFKITRAPQASGTESAPTAPTQDTPPRETQDHDAQDLQEEDAQESPGTEGSKAEDPQLPDSDLNTEVAPW